MIDEPALEREWIAGHLEDVPVVEWDRFVVYRNQHEEQVVEVYGWIGREDGHAAESLDDDGPV